MLSASQLARRFFNTTMGQLEADRCASDGVHSAMTSRLMLTSHGFMLTVIGASTVLAFFASRMLWSHNVFTNCTRALLMSALINGVWHQWTMAVIRIRAIFHVYYYFTDPCSILFPVSSCFLENMSYYMTNLFTSCCLVSLFLDRLFSLNLTSQYHHHQGYAAAYYILFQLSAPILVLYWVFYGVPYVGYVPLCNYPPPLSLGKFYWVNECRIYMLLTVSLGSLVVLEMNKLREKRIIHNVYDTDSRYKSYESFWTTSAVFIIIITQIFCLVSTSTGTALLHKIEPQIDETTFHSGIAFMAGLTYSNFLLPIIILISSRHIISRRYEKIEKIKASSGKEGFEEHFAALHITWR